MIIGLTGKNASGKGEVGNYLKKKGFEYHSLSDALRDEATKRNIEHSRDNLIKLGNELREEFGSNILAKRINEKITNSGANNFVVDSIRNPHEIEELRKNKEFVLVAIEASVETRFKRLLERGRAGDAKTFEEFKKQEEKENVDSETNQQLNKCIEMADKVINNAGILEELHKKVDGLLK